MGEANTRRAHSRSKLAYIEAHNAVQWLARVTRSYALTQDGEFSLFFDPATRRVTTPEIAPAIRLGLHLPSLVFQFEESGDPTPHALDVDERSATEVEAWLLAELLHRGFDRDRFHKDLPYEWSHPMCGDEIKFASHDLASELDRLTQRLAAAANILSQAENGVTERDAQLPGCNCMTLLPRAFCIGFSVPAQAGEIKAALELKENAEDDLYRVTQGAPRTCSVEIVASGAAPSTESLAEQLIKAIESMKSA